MSKEYTGIVTRFPPGLGVIQLDGEEKTLATFDGMTPSYQAFDDIPKGSRVTVTLKPKTNGTAIREVEQFTKIEPYVAPWRRMARDFASGSLRVATGFGRAVVAAAPRL